MDASGDASYVHIATYSCSHHNSAIKEYWPLLLRGGGGGGGGKGMQTQLQMKWDGKFNIITSQPVARMTT